LQIFIGRPEMEGVFPGMSYVATLSRERRE
jgi:hypothetical protein